SILAKAPETIEGRDVAYLVTDGCDAEIVEALREAIEANGARMVVVAPSIGGVRTRAGRPMPADGQLAGSPSVLFDAVVLAPSAEGGAALARDAGAVAFVHDAFAHAKVIGHVGDAADLMEAAGVEADEGIVALDAIGDVADFIAAAKRHRIWEREAKVRPAP
ncbi:MAG: catalase HPII, partial [Alphaproteobacteria bacterium]